jgi:hypothetical protein
MHAFDGKGAHFNGQGKKHSIWDKQTKLGTLLSKTFLGTNKCLIF